MHPLLAPTSGTVWKIAIPAGENVAKNDVVLIVESMKMEVPVEAPVAGRLVELLVAEGDTVHEDQILANVEGAA